MPPRRASSPSHERSPSSPQGEESPHRLSQSSQSTQSTSPLEKLWSWSHSRGSRSGSTSSKNERSVAEAVKNTGVMAISTTGMHSEVIAAHAKLDLVRTRSESAQSLLVRTNKLAGAVGGVRGLMELSEEKETGIRNFIEGLARVLTVTKDEAPQDNRVKTEYFDAKEGQPVASSDDMRENNLFGYEPNDARRLFAHDATDDSGVLRNKLDIYAYTHEGDKVFMTALLDTLAESNFIRKEKVDLTGTEMLPYVRETVFVTGDGRQFTPIGEVKLTWGVNQPDKYSPSCRTWDIQFLVMGDDVPYDMILGIHFIRKAEVFKPNAQFFCPLIGWKQSKDVKDSINDKKRRQDERRSSEMEEKAAQLERELNATSSATANATATTQQSAPRQSTAHQGSSSQ